MDAFAFLEPWIDRLAPALVAIDDRADRTFFLHDRNGATLAPHPYGIVLMPFYDIPEKAWLGQPVSPIIQTFPAVRCAMEIVALALRVEPCVLTLLRNEKGDPLVENVDALDQGGTSIEIAFAQNDYLSASTVLAFFTATASASLLSEFATAKQRLHALDHTQRLDSYRIPLAISARLADRRTESYAEALAQIYSLVYGLDVANNGRVLVTPTPYRPTRVSLPLGAVPFEWIKQLKVEGIPIDRVVAGEGSHTELPRAVELLRGATILPLAVEATLTGDPTMQSLFQALQMGHHIQSLALTIQPKCDGALLASVLAACRSTCPSLQRLEIDCPKTLMPKHVKAFEETMAMATRGRYLKATLRKPLASVAAGTELEAFPCNETYLVFVVLPGNRLQEINTSTVEMKGFEAPQAETAAIETVLDVVRLRLTTYTESARRLVAFIVACLPHRLRALTLEIQASAMPNDYFWTHPRSDVEGGPSLDGDAVASILAAAPQLTKLELRLPSHLPLDDLLVAYESGRCHVRALALANAPAVSLSLLAALADPTTRAFQTIEELSLVCPDKTTTFDAFMEAVETVLKKNDWLAFLRLKGNTAHTKKRLETATRVSRTTRLRLAFASVVHYFATRHPLGRFDAELLARIVAFAEAPQCCRVELVW